MGTQTKIVKKIRKKQADYVLVLKANQGNLLEDVVLYFADSEFLKKSVYEKVVEKKRGQVERREYWQTDDVARLGQKKDWAGLKTVILTRNNVAGADGGNHALEKLEVSRWAAYKIAYSGARMCHNGWVNKA